MEDRVDTSSLLGDYLDDARNHIDAFDRALLEFERDAKTSELSTDLVTDLLGSLHTLKGNSGMMGFVTIQQYIHQIEGVFKRLLDAPDLLDEPVLNALFESASILRAAVEQAGTTPLPDLGRETALLETLCAGTARPKPPAGAKKRRARAAASGPDDIPAATAVAEADAPSPVAPPASAAQAKTNILRVDFERLDHLLNLAGELVIHKTKLNQIAKAVEDVAGGAEIATELPRLSQMIDKTTSELQEAIMRVRMLPVRQVFQRFPRMVRDLAKQKGKSVNLVFSGEDTEIDKTVIDAIGDPLIHLIRNSIDHGIEPPDVRAAAGKDRTGTIMLSARQESSHIMITVADDGGGMHAERIRRKAAERGLLTPDQQLSEEDIYGLVFAPGFSTAETVTETSGRGVGLDVVKKVISEFNGIIEVKSTPGFGTEFILKMPLTLAIIPALLVEASSELFAVPLTAVLESVKVRASNIHTVDGREVIEVRGAVLPVKRLNRIFGLPTSRRDHYYLVILGRAEKRVGMLVDRLRGQQEVVIKALDDYLGDTVGVSGATILGDGRVVLIVDTSRVVG